MNNVKPLRPLESIPHMLRLWADLFERGEEPMPTTATLVCVVDPNAPPIVYGAGKEGSRLEQAGALFFCAKQVVETELEPSP